MDRLRRDVYWFSLIGWNGCDWVQLIAMFKILAKSFRPLFLRPFAGCSHKKQQLLALSHQLLTQYQTLKGWKTVRMMHSLTMARYDPAVKDSAKGGNEEEAKLEVIMGSLSGQLHLLPQREVNMLLEVLKERGYRYDRTVPIFKALNKQAKLLFGRQYRAVEFPKTLQLYRQLGFPKQTWVKMLSLFLQIDSGRMKNEEALRMSVNQFMRLTILALEQPFAPLRLIKGLIERLVKENASTLDTLTTLYHITRILPKSLKANTQYQLVRSNAREVLFNPYPDLQQEQNQQKPTPQQAEANDQAQKQTLKLKLDQVSSQIMKLFFSAVDVKKVQEAIIKSIEADIQPLTKQSLLLACDIAQLRPTILTFLNENIQKLTPVEFLHLLRRVPAETVGQFIKRYQEKLGGYMNIQEKCFFLLEKHRFFRTPVTTQAILSIINSTPTLNYEEFTAIGRLLEELAQSDQQKIGQILSLIKSKSQV